MKVKNDEIVGVTQFRRELPALLEELEDGRREKVVLMKNGKIRAVVTTAPTYVEMQDD